MLRTPNPPFMRKIILFILVTLLCSPTAQAAECETSTNAASESTTALSLEIEISTLYPNPNSGESEWIELTNHGDEMVDLSYYTLEDATARPWTLSGTLEEVLKVEGFSFQLNNSGDTVTLKTNDGTVVDTWTYSSSTQGEILYRNAEVQTSEGTNTSNDTDSTNNSNTGNESASENTEQTVSTPTEWPIFSEALPNPEGSDSTEEWIELYNPYGETLNLNGLYLDDMEGGSDSYELSGSLSAESYLLVNIEDSGITLNNDGDHVRLLGVDSEVLWDISYSDSEEGMSYAAFDDSYEWTDEATPGYENARSSSQSAEETEENANETASETNYQDGDLSDEVAITEVFPNPEGSDIEEEWIEITNLSNSTINLGNWTLDDGEGGSKPFVFPDATVLEPGESIVIFRVESGLALNNTNEVVQLLDFTSEVMDEIFYESSVEDFSYAEIEVEEVQSVQASLESLGNAVFSTWEWVSPSPGKQNPVWKQIRGEVLKFDGTLLTLFDGMSRWTFKVNEENGVDSLLYQTGNHVLVLASSVDGLYKVMRSELIESRDTSQARSSPWSLMLTGVAILAWSTYEIYKRWKVKKNEQASCNFV